MRGRVRLGVLALEVGEAPSPKAGNLDVDPVVAPADRLRIEPIFGLRDFELSQHPRLEGVSVVVSERGEEIERGLDAAEGVFRASQAAGLSHQRLSQVTWCLLLHLTDERAYPAYELTHSGCGQDVVGAGVDRIPSRQKRVRDGRLAFGPAVFAVRQRREVDDPGRR